jgi:hypothetical protein
MPVVVGFVIVFVPQKISIKQKTINVVMFVQMIFVNIGIRAMYKQRRGMPPKCLKKK